MRRWWRALALVAALVVPLLGGSAIASPASADGDAQLVGTGSFHAMVADPSGETNVYFGTDAGNGVAVQGTDGLEVGVDYTVALRITAELAAATGVGAGAAVELDSELGIAVASTASEPLEVLSAVPVSSSGRQAQPDQPVAGAALQHSVDVVIITNGGTNLPSDQQVQALVSTLGAYWADGTSGAATPVGEVTINQIQRVASSNGCEATTDWFGTDNVPAHLDDAAAAAGFGSITGYTNNAANGRHLVLIRPESCSGLWGLGAVGSTTSNGWVLLPARSLTALDTSWEHTLLHEFGHNLGLGHANLDGLNCTSGTLWLENASGCAEQEYYDLYSVMGVDLWLGTTALPAAQRAAFGLPSGYAHEHSGSSTATYMIDSASAGSGVRAVRIVEPVTGREFLVEYRNGSGADADSAVMSPTYQGASASLGLAAGLCTEPGEGCSSGVGFGTGVRIVELLDEYAGDFLLDKKSVLIPVVTDAAHPQFYEAALEAGDGFISSGKHLRITVDAVDGVQATVTVTTAAGDVTADPSAPTAVYRFWSQEFRAHFFTTSADEKQLIQATYPESTWKYEGIAYQAYSSQVAGTVPLYRFWSQEFRGHFFTTSEAERDQVIAMYPESTWKYEGIAYYVYPEDSAQADTQTVHRFWSQQFRHHFYTASEAEKEHVIATYPQTMWKYEQVAFKVPTE